MATKDDDVRSGLRALFRTAGLIVLVFVTGVVGYSVLGGPEHGLLDAVYMTMITLTTVGYAEIIDLSGNPAGRIFTTALLVFGVGSFVYFFSNLTAFMVEGHLDALFRNRRMKKKIDELEGHYIVCGIGSTGQHIVAELFATRRPFVAIDTDEDRIRALEARLGTEFPSVVGDATEDAVLEEAGLARAGGVAACIAADKDNLIVTVSARLLNPKLRIICRCIDERIADKMKNAGADAVVSPNTIGGLRMVSELVRPHVVSFLDTMLRYREEGLRVEEMEIHDGSPLLGVTVGQLRGKKIEGVLIVALRDADGQWQFNPGDDVTLEGGSALVFMGTPSGREGLAAST